MASEIDAVISSFNKKHKAEILVRGRDLKHLTWQRTGTGSLGLDAMLGGGWPLNGMNEVIGLESSGKTTLALKTVAWNQAHHPDHHTLWVASEEFDHERAATMNVDEEQITFVMTNVMEIVYDSVLTVMEERAADAVVIDSFPALVPSEEGEKNMADFTIGKGAILTNKFMRKSYEAMNRSLVEFDRPVLFLLINQWRDRVGVLYGDPRTTPGGKGKNYRFLTRVEVSRLEWLSDGTTKVGQTIKCQTMKNKTAPPRRECQVDYYFSDSGEFRAGDFDIPQEIFNLALVNDVIHQKGSWFSFGGQKWQGEKGAWAAIHHDPALMEAVDTEVRTVLGILPPTPTKVATKRRGRVSTS